MNDKVDMAREKVMEYFNRWIDDDTEWDNARVILQGLILTAHLEACVEHIDGQMCGTRNALGSDASPVWYCKVAEKYVNKNEGI